MPALKPKRKTETITIEEFEAPLLLAYPSAKLALSLRERKLDFGSEEALSLMVADMVVDEDGARRYSAADVSAFFEDISADSLRVLMEKCFEMQAPRGASGNPKPSTSA